MSDVCAFCLEHVPLSPVNDMVFDIKPGSYDFKEIMKDVFMIPVVSGG
jgi:hypothetical protein